MKATRLLAQVAKLIDEHGDQDVEIIINHDDDTTSEFPVNEVRIERVYQNAKVRELKYFAIKGGVE